jgi:hypothetical protein
MLIKLLKIKAEFCEIHYGAYLLQPCYFYRLPDNLSNAFLELRLQY